MNVLKMGKVHVVMSGDVFHVVAMGEEIIDITKICISDIMEKDTPVEHPGRGPGSLLSADYPG